MALEDVNSGTEYYWYNSASGNMSDYSSTTSKNFGAGKTNTTNMIAKWNNSSYGSQNSRDMWGVIQSQVNEGWFVPSRKEWAAFAGSLEKRNTTYELNDVYWSSSQNNTNNAWNANFNNGYMNNNNVNNNNYVRLSASFIILYTIKIEKFKN